MTAGSARVVVGVTGATGAIYARAPARAAAPRRRCETHLVATPGRLLNVHHELGLDRKALEALADVAYNPGDVGAAIASGSFAARGDGRRAVLDEVARGDRPRPLGQPADARRRRRPEGAAARCVLMVRETPLNLAHLRNMTSATEMGAIVFPPLPAFYHRPTTIDEIVDDTVERVLALLGIEGAAPKSWPGL